MTVWLKNNWFRIILLSVVLIWILGSNYHQDTYADIQFLFGGLLGNALEFRGANNRVSLGNSSLLKPGAGDFSVAFWIKSTDLSSFCVIGDRLSSGGTNTSWSIRLRAGKLAMFIEEFGAAWRQYANSGNILDGIWHSYIVTYNFLAGTMKVYVDGNDETTFINGSGVLVGTDNVSNIFIGEFTDGSGDLTGFIDDLAIFKRELTLAEAGDIHSGGPLGVPLYLRVGQNFPSGGLIDPTGLWHHDESVQGTAPGGADTEDSSGNGLHGTMLNMLNNDFGPGIVPLLTAIPVFMRHYRNMRA